MDTYKLRTLSNFLLFNIPKINKFKTTHFTIIFRVGR